MGTMTAGLPLPANHGKCPANQTALPRKTVPLPFQRPGARFFNADRDTLSITQMLFATRFCQHDLVLALPEAGPVFICAGFMAVHT